MSHLNTLNPLPIRLKSLDSLRGLAALYVMMAHYTSHFFFLYPELARPIIKVDYPNIAVRLFFILSGFVILMTAERIKDPLSFVKARFFRLYPAFWGALILTYTTVYFFGLKGRVTSLMDATINSTMLPGLFNTPLVDSSYWTLQIEWSFYFLIFILIASNLVRIMDSILILLLTWSAFDFHFKFTHSLGDPLGTIVNFISIKNDIAWFSCGICIYKLLSVSSLKWILILIFSTIVVYLGEGLRGCSLCILLVGVMRLATTGRLHFLETPALLFLGSISYCLYLVHQNIGFVIIKELTQHGININISITFAIAISLILAIIISKFIEKPCITYFKQRQSTLKN